MLPTLVLALALATAQAESADPKIDNCIIASINDQAVPGADAGVLTSLKVQEGMYVTAGMEIGAVDDNEARALVQVRQLEFDVALQKAKSDINIRHAEAATEVAKATLAGYKKANRSSPGTVSDIDIMRTELEQKKAELATEQTREEQIENQLTAKAKRAEVVAAQVALNRRILRAPFDGVVTEVVRKPGEWVAAGDPVVHIVGVKRLRVMGNLDARQYGPSDVEGRPVTVTVELPRGRTIEVPGKVTYVSPVVVLDQLAVWAEIETPMENNVPVVRAGLNASMTIHVNRPVAQQDSPRAQPISAVRPASGSRN